MTMRINTLTGLEQADAEEAVGIPLHRIEDDNAPKVRIYLALEWVLRRRETPALKFTEHAQSSTFAQALAYVYGDDEAAEGTEGAADGEGGPDEEVEPESPFPAEAASGPEAGAADAEGAVLPGDGAVAG